MIKFENIKHCLKSNISLEKKEKCIVDLESFKETVPNEYKLKNELTQALVSSQKRIEFELKLNASLKSRKFNDVKEIDSAYVQSKQIVDIVKAKEDNYWNNYFDLKEGKKQKEMIDFSFNFALLFSFLFVFILLSFIYAFFKSNTNKRMKAIVYLKHFKLSYYAEIVERMLSKERKEFKDEFSNNKTLISLFNRFKVSSLSLREQKKEKEILISSNDIDILETVDKYLELLEEIYHKDISIKSKEKTNEIFMKISKDVEKIDFSKEKKYVFDNLDKIKSELKKSIYNQSED